MPSAVEIPGAETTVRQQGSEMAGGTEDALRSLGR